METVPARKGVVSGAYLSLLCEYLAEQGQEPSTLLDLDPATIDARRRYPTSFWRECLKTSARRLDDRMLGFHLGQRFTAARFGVVGYVLLSCRDLGAALQRMQQFHPLLSDAALLDIVREDAEVKLSCRHDNGSSGALLDETNITAFVQVSRSLTDRRVVPERVCFVHAPPADKRPYEEFFGCDVLFGQARMEVYTPPSFLELPLRQSDPVLEALMQEQALKLLGSLPEADAFVSSVRDCIIRHVKEGELSIERAAGCFNMSSRTLHRRLKEKGITFKALSDETRQQLAAAYLGEGELSLAEVAWLLGYSEQSAFTRAFRRWYDMTPNEWRGACA